MDRARVAALLILLAGCSPDERARRDFEEVGKAVVGGLRMSIDQGTCLSRDGAALTARFRASAPEETLTVESSASAAATALVEIDDVAPDVELSGPVTGIERAGHAVSFAVAVPAGEAVTVALRRPGAATPSPWRFAWVGDVQGGLDRFARIRALIDADPSIELVVFSGDVTEQGTAEEVRAFVAAADELARPWYSLIGNHDTFASDSIFQELVGRANVAFDWRGARLVLVDSASATLDERVERFLERSVDAAPSLSLVAMHIPPLDYDGLRDGGFASRMEGAKVMAVLADAEVDLLLAGHLHTRHVGSVAGVETVISGNGGVGLDQKMDGSGLHYLAIDVDAARGSLTVTPVDVP